MVRLGGRDPLTSYTASAIQSFSHFEQRVEDEVRAALEAVPRARPEAFNGRCR